MSKFKVGDFVVSRCQMEAIRLFGEKSDYPSRIPQVVLYQILAIIQHQGTGRLTVYRCRGCNVDHVYLDLVDFDECELEPAPNKPFHEKRNKG